MNYQALVKLADKDFAQEAAQYGAELPAEIREALEEEIAASKKAAAREAARTIVALSKSKDEYITTRVMAVRQLRAQIERLKKEMAEINHAYEYGTSSQNYLPLMYRLGKISERDIRMGVINSKLLNLPPKEVKTEEEKSQQ